ncbi:MAG: PTS sugar transporter subunit IIA [Chitinispirillaceae bacterium]|nr:PTS sugar transporter subunit IIA [Chitinispirillaceae bacterium]
MKIQDIVEKGSILPNILEKDKKSVLTLMVNFMASRYNLPNVNEIIEGIIHREAEMSTGIGYGIAIPHARIQGINRVYLCIGRTPHGIEFQAIDEQPVYLLFMMLSPKHTSAEYTQILSKISRIMSYEEVRTNLLLAKTAEQMYDIIIKSENKYVIDE